MILGFKLGWMLLAAIGAVIGLIQRSKSQTAPKVQQPVAPSPVPTAPPAVAQPPVQVVIHNVMPPQPAPVAPQAAARNPAAASLPDTVALVLGRRDHGIYVTDRSTFVLPHPDAERLLERLDFILFHAAHRDGDPYSIPPALDDSAPGPVLQLPMPLVDDGFDDVPPRVLTPDGGLWVARLGHPLAPLDVVPRPWPVAADPINDEAEEEAPVEDLFDDPDFDQVPLRRLPDADDRFWVASYGAAFQPLDAMPAHE